MSKISDILDGLSVAPVAVIGIASALAAVAANIAIMAVYHRTGSQPPELLPPLTASLQLVSLASICFLLYRIASMAQTVGGLKYSFAALTDRSEKHISLLEDLLAQSVPLDHATGLHGALSADAQLALLALRLSTFQGKCVPPIDALFWAEWGKRMFDKLVELDAEARKNDNDERMLEFCRQKVILLNHLTRARKEFSVWIDKEWKYHLIILLIERVIFLESVKKKSKDPLYRAVAVDEDIDSVNNGDTNAKELLLGKPRYKFQRIFCLQDRRKMQHFLSAHAGALRDQIKEGAELGYYCPKPGMDNAVRNICEIGIYSNIAFGQYTNDRSNVVCFNPDQVSKWRDDFEIWWSRSEKIALNGDMPFLEGDAVCSDASKSTNPSTS